MIDYELAPGPWPRRKSRTTVLEGTGQVLYPAIEFEDGTWYREQSSEMERTIREGRLMEKAGTSASQRTQSWSISIPAGGLYW